MSRRWTLRALPWLVVLGFFVAWQIVCMVFAIKVFILPAPSDIWASLVRFRAPILDHAIQTAFTTLVGFGIAVVFGLALGIVLGASRTVYEALYPVMIGFNSIPKVAVVPILVIWFGIGTIPAILTSFLISFFPIVVNVATGLATIEPELQDVMRALGARKLQQVHEIQRQLVLREDAQNAERGTAQAERILVARGFLANAPDAHQHLCPIC